MVDVNKQVDDAEKKAEAAAPRISDWVRAHPGVTFFVAAVLVGLLFLARAL